MPKKNIRQNTRGTKSASEMNTDFLYNGSLYTLVEDLLPRGEEALLMSIAQDETPVPAGFLALRLHLTTGRLANILHSLEKKGLILREHSTMDRRQVVVLLTDDGKEAADELKETYAKKRKNLEDRLGPEDTQELMRILKKASRAV